jgi:hypothetical protein
MFYELRENTTRNYQLNYKSLPRTEARNTGWVKDLAWHPALYESFVDSAPLMVRNKSPPSDKFATYSVQPIKQDTIRWLMVPGPNSLEHYQAFFTYNHSTKTCQMPKEFEKWTEWKKEYSNCYLELDKIEQNFLRLEKTINDESKRQYAPGGDFSDDAKE